ncbi:MAG: ADP-ribosylglycohydrolase family protein, partial [Kiritimatiellae bacterium]|nr:ADP-ribosylglycohydrolase family protein [Kiritimatiellia bacterium]
LAGVAQPRLGADWAGLAAAAVAACFDSQLDAAGVVAAALKVAEENNRNVWEELRFHLSPYHGAPAFDQAGLRQDLLNWFFNYGKPGAGKDLNRFANNPLRFVLPVIRAFDGDARKALAVLLWPPHHQNQWFCYTSIMHGVTATLAGAMLGARHGRQAFPAEWRKWAEPIAASWFPMTDVVEQTRARERDIIEIHETMAQRRQNGMSQLEDKIYGCLLASSIGNAMGSPPEWEWYEVIDEKWPGGVKTILDPRCLENEDDNQLAMLLVETYIERAGRPVLGWHFANTWKRCPNGYNSNHLLQAGWEPRYTGMWEGVTGSTVMCMEPVGLYRLGDPEGACIDATAVSYMYQRGLDVTAAAILAAATANALRPDATVDSVLATALKCAPTTPFRTFDEIGFESCRHYLEACLDVAAKYDDVFAVRKELYEKCLMWSPIDPLEVIGLSLAMFKVARGDVRQAAIGGTNIGRDADTIAGRCTMLAGALNGAGAVPAEWIGMFSATGLERIRHHAGAMVELMMGHKLKVLKARQVI